MARDRRGLSNTSHVVGARPCPGGSTDHVMLDLTDDEARLAGLPPGQPVHVDRLRQPINGNLVWVELVRHGSTQRLVRRYARDSGWVTLSAGTPNNFEIWETAPSGFCVPTQTSTRSGATCAVQLIGSIMA